MKAHFKHQRKVEGKLYGKGEHHLDDKLASHWYIKALVKEGVVVLSEAKAEPGKEESEEKPAPQPQRSKR